MEVVPPWRDSRLRSRCHDAGEFLGVWLKTTQDDQPDYNGTFLLVQLYIYVYRYSVLHDRHEARHNVRGLHKLNLCSSRSIPRDLDHSYIDHHIIIILIIIIIVVMDAVISIVVIIVVVAIVVSVTIAVNIAGIG